VFRSAELAQIAGTTVRTLRHYHQLGVLPEPPRTSGGYRTYDVHHLVRLLRIRRLAALGIPLERVGELLDASTEDEGTRAELDALDAELTTRIDDLTARRDQLRQARSAAAGGGSLDTPAVVAGYVDRLRAAGVPAEAMAFEQGAAVLLNHFAAEGFDVASSLGRMYAELADEEFLALSTSLAESMFDLRGDATDAEVDAVARTFAEFAGPLVADSAVDTGNPVLTRVLQQFASTTLSPVQLRVLDRAGELLGP